MVLIENDNDINWYNDDLDTLLDLVSENYNRDVARHIKDWIDVTNEDIDWYNDELEKKNKLLENIENKLKYLEENYDKLNMEDVKEVTTGLLKKM